MRGIHRHASFRQRKTYVGVVPHRQPSSYDVLRSRLTSTSSKITDTRSLYKVTISSFDDDNDLRLRLRYCRELLH